MKQAAYNAGRVDVQAKSGSIAEIVTKTKETAEKVAQQQAEIKKNVKASKVNIKELAPSAGKWSVDPKIDMDTLTTKQTAAVSYLKAVSEVSGINITLMSGVDVPGAFAVETGHYDGVTNTLYVSVNAGMQSITDITGSAILKTASHEITHYIAASGTQTYSLLEDYVLSRFTEQYGEKSVDNRIEDIQEQYKDQVGKELTREQAKEEMVAAACEMMLKNSEVFEKLARQNLSLAQRIKAGLDGFIKKLSANRKAAFENLDATSPEARAIAASETSLKETQKLWDNALKGAIKENEGKKSAGTGSMSEIRSYDYSKTFAQQIDDYKAGKFPKYDTLIVGATPEVFQKIGLNALPMTYATGHLKDVLQGNKVDHNFGEANLKRIPEAMKNPVAIIASNTKPQSSIVAILDLSFGNKPMFAAVEIEGYGTMNGERIDSNAITSIHTRTNAAKLLADAITNDSDTAIRLFYLNKKSATALFNASGVQFPGGKTVTDGYIHSIRDAGSFVNTKFENVTQTQQFKRWFGDWQKNPKRASKVVNADGTPKIVYHGTNADFWTFDLGKSGQNFGDVSEGLIFFTNKRDGYPDSAADYARKAAENGGKERVIECYLDIKKPLHLYSDGFYTPTAYFDHNAESIYSQYLKGDYDGIIIENSNKSADDSIIYMVDNPTQIKSATDNIGTFDRNNPDIRYQLRDKRDTEYAKLAKDPEKNEKRLSQLVEQAAKAAGYDSPLLYHGTQSFGFTAFDLAKTDDGRSIFLTSNPDIASTYSGISGSRRISEAADIDVNGMSVREVAQMLNRFPPESGIDYAYSYVPGKAEIAEQVDSGIKELRKLTESLRERFANDSPEMYKLNHLRNVLDIGKTDSLSATLWTMLNKTDIFNGHTDFVNNLEQNIRLLKKAPESGGFVVEKSLDGYSIEVFTESAARKELSANLRRGNYALYAKLGNSLTVEGDGENWNALDFRAPDSKYEIQEDDGRYKIINKSTRSAEWANGKMSWNSKEEAQRIIDGFSDKNNWAKRLSNTRQIAEYAKEQGYDSVLFRNIRDNGGQNASTDFDTTADVYVIFNPNNVKSADTVTRDGNGNVIPLSQRFNAGENDIRFELRTTDSGTKYALVTEDISKVEVPGKPDASLGAKARYILNERFRNTVLQVGENDKVYVNKGGTKEYASPAATISADVYTAKMGAAPELDNLLKTATNVSYKADDGRHPDAVRGWKYYDVLFAVKNSNAENGYSVFDGKLNVKRIAKGDLFYDITDIKEVTGGITGQNILSSISADSSGDSNSIFDIAENVNTEFELRSDENQFNPRKELSNLFMEIAQNEQEKKSLRSYQAAIHELNNTEIEISKLQQEMQGTDKLKSPQKYYELQNKLRQAEAKLNRYDGRLVQLEATKPMKDLIARREQRLKEQFARSSTTRAKYRNNIKKNIRSLDKKLRTNSGQKHVLLELQPVVAQLLNVFTENTSVFKKEQLAKLREIYAKFNPEADSKMQATDNDVKRWKSTAEYSSAYSEMIYDLIEQVRPLVQGKRLIDLDTELLAAVNDIVSNIKQKKHRPGITSKTALFCCGSERTFHGKATAEEKGVRPNLVCGRTIK